MTSTIFLSLCIPTNGVTEWVVPVLDSIYREQIAEELFEVVVTDNGENKEFFWKMKEYSDLHQNLIYKKTTAIGFENQIEAFKIAKGQLIKFVNHRMQFVPGGLKYLVEYAEKNREKKPITYFMNGENKKLKQYNMYSSFDEYIREMSYWSSWSAGTAVWKEDFENIDLSIRCNSLFPHTALIFSNRKSELYVIDNQIIMKDLLTDETKKGKYNLFYAFAVEYVSIILQLYREKSISIGTFLNVKKDNLEFISGLYWRYIIRKKACSYDLSGYKEAIEVYYNKSELDMGLVKWWVKRVKNKIAHK